MQNDFYIEFGETEKEKILEAAETEKMDLQGYLKKCILKQTFSVLLREDLKKCNIFRQTGMGGLEECKFDEDIENLYEEAENLWTDCEEEELDPAVQDLFI